MREEKQIENTVSPAMWTWAGLALFTAVWVVFWPALGGEFVWDDRQNLLENQNFRGFTWDNLKWAFTQAHVGHFQPLTWLSFSLDHALWGMNPKGYHGTNILLHGFNALLFMQTAFLIFGRLFPVPERTKQVFFASLLAAAFFALHPLRVESVAWITERRDVLCGVFFLISINAYLLVRGKNASRTRFWFVVSLMAFALSLLSKALGMALPLVLVVLDFYPLNRMRQGESLLKGGFRLLLEKWPFLGLAVISGLAALFAQSDFQAMLGAETHPLMARAAQAFYGLAFYIRSTFFSIHWYPLYEIPFPLNPWAWPFVLSALAVCITTAILIWFHKRLPALLAVWLCYGLLLGPVLGIAQSGNQLVADRYSYLSCLGLALLLAGGLVKWWLHTSRGSLQRILCMGVSGLILMFWPFMTFKQIAVWRHEQALWEHALGWGESAMAHNNLGVLATRAGKVQQGIDAYEKSLAVAPTFTIAFDNLVRSVLSHHSFIPENRLSSLAKTLKTSLGPHKNRAEGWYAHGLLSIRLRDPESALESLKKVVQFEPGHSMAWSKLGLISQMRGEAATAEKYYSQAVSQQSDLGEAWLGLGIARIGTHQFAEALAAFEKATQLMPENALGWAGLGHCYIQTGRSEEARKALEQALKIDPNNGRAQKLLNSLP